MTEKKDAEKIRLSERLRFRAVDDEGVLVQMENGRVLVVNEVGLFIVQALDRQAMTVAQLAESVSYAFEVDAESAKADVVAFLDQLRAEQAINSAGHSGRAPAEG